MEVYLRGTAEVCNSQSELLVNCSEMNGYERKRHHEHII